MEALLNILWFVVCLSVAWTWLRHWRNADRNSAANQLCALVLALVLLFPVISVSDDLYCAQLAVETSTTQKSWASGISGKSGQASVPANLLLASLPVHPVTVLPVVMLGAVETDSSPLLPSFLFFRQQQNRPPPSLSLA